MKKILITTGVLCLVCSSANAQFYPDRSAGSLSLLIMKLRLITAQDTRYAQATRWSLPSTMGNIMVGVVAMEIIAAMAEDNVAEVEDNAAAAVVEDSAAVAVVEDSAAVAAGLTGKSAINGSAPI